MAWVVLKVKNNTVPYCSLYSDDAAQFAIGDAGGNNTVLSTETDTLASLVGKDPKTGQDVYMFNLPVNRQLN
jgi:hypothetical protein